jgi:hypothetical protein
VRASAERGAALIVVLWTVAVLSALAGEFAIAMRRDAESARNFKQETLARYTAFAGFNEALLAIDAYNGEIPYDVEEVDDRRNLDADTDRDGDADTDENGRRSDRGRESDGRRRDGELGEDEEELDLIRTLIEGRGEWVEGHFAGAIYPDYEVRTVDETGKIPLNAAAVDEVLLREIVLNLDYDELTASTVADSIMDWKDDDDLHRAEGAEDEYYRGLERPYPCKDAPFDSIEELLLVRGVTRAMYQGDGVVPGLRDIFTVAHDRSRLTVRTVSKEVEWALCGDPEDRGFDEDDLGGRTDDQQVIDVQECLQGTSLAVRRGEAQGNPQLGHAMVEARVKDPADAQRVLAHIGAQIQFKTGGGFQTVQWYDSIFEE